MIGKALDRLASVVSPMWGLRRMRARATIDQINNLVGNHPGAGYEGGQLNRLNSHRLGGSFNENAIPREQIKRLGQSSWHLYRNNPQCRKMVRSLESKVIGSSPRPQPQATLADGTPFVEFRRRAVQLWQNLSRVFDYRGTPGAGGQTLTGLHKTAFRQIVLGGDVLWRYRRLSSDQQITARCPIPLQLQLIHSERLDDTKIDDNIFHGVELDGDDRRVAYHILDRHPSDPRRFAVGESRRIPASEIGHLFAFEDIDQICGVPWLAAAVLKMRSSDNYEFAEMTAAEMAACVVLGFKRSSGQSGGIGVQGDADWDLTDSDGNAITNMSPGMIIDLGQNGAIDGFNPQRPNTNAVEFLRHMLTSQAAAIPGVKGSTVHGDYRRSSFASERAADNDTWPEIEDVQSWFFSGFSQPIFEQIVMVGVESGYFDSVPGFRVADFRDRMTEYLAATWQGPVARSINPKDDAAASRARVQNLQSTPQREAALLGNNWQEMLTEIAEFREYGLSLGVPEDIINQAMGIDQADQPEQSDSMDPTDSMPDDSEDIDNGDEGQETDAAASAA